MGAVVRGPFEIVKQNMQAGKGSTAQLVSSIYISHGLRGFYRGLSSLIIREVAILLVF